MRISRQHLLLALRIAVAVAGIGYIAYALHWESYIDADGNRQPGVVETFRQADVWLLLAGFATIAPVYAILAVRWWMLMRARGLGVPMSRAFKLSMVGNFFNYCMPGTTGGDVIRAFYAARGSGRKADVVMSIVVDRVTGMLGLVLLAGVAGLFMLDNPVARNVTMYIWIGNAALAAGALVYFSGTMRRLIHLDRWLFRLPGGGLLKSIDAAVVAYRHHMGTVIASILLAAVLHFCLATGTALAGFALGMDRPLGLLLTVLPVIFFGGAIPVSYQGLGIMEALGQPLLVNPPACTVNHVIGMLMVLRCYQIIYSLFGALFLLQGDIRLHPERTEADGAELSSHVTAP